MNNPIDRRKATEKLQKRKEDYPDIIVVVLTSDEPPEY
jgi:hypothetical protein